MEKFAGYGFNKSHSAAYALISYQTAWLKAYHPTEFLAATMSSDMDDTDKVQIFCRDAQDNGVEVLPPDVNHSGYRFEPVADKHTEGQPPRTMRYGLGAVKGTGQGAVEEIPGAQGRRPVPEPVRLLPPCQQAFGQPAHHRGADQGGRLRWHRAQPRRHAGLGAHGHGSGRAGRAQRQPGLAVRRRQRRRGGRRAGQGRALGPAQEAHREKSALGYYSSGHLFDAWRDEVRRIVPMQLARLEPQRDLQWMCGVLAGVRTMMTRRGKMVFAVLDDGTAQVEISVFNELYEKHRNRLREDQLIIVQGKVSNDDYSGGMRIVADQLYDLQLAREARAKSLRVKLNGGADAARLRQLLNPFRAEPENGIPGVPVDIVTPRTISCARSGWARNGACAWPTRCSRTLNAWTARRRRGHLLMRKLRIVHPKPPPASAARPHLQEMNARARGHHVEAIRQPQALLATRLSEAGFTVHTLEMDGPLTT